MCSIFCIKILTLEVPTKYFLTTIFPIYGTCAVYIHVHVHCMHMHACRCTLTSPSLCVPMMFLSAHQDVITHGAEELPPPPQPSYYSTSMCCVGICICVMLHVCNACACTLTFPSSCVPTAKVSVTRETTQGQPSSTPALGMSITHVHSVHICTPQIFVCTCILSMCRYICTCMCVH